MLPVGTEVEYDGQQAYVKFACPEFKQMTICTKEWRDEETGYMRQVCLVVYEHDFHKIKLITGNQSR